jgi:tetratricopeptide (TPR) repeat protein
VKYFGKTKFTFYDESDVWNEIPCEVEVEAENLEEAIEKIILQTKQRTLADSYSQPIGIEIVEIRDEKGEIVYKPPSKDVKNENVKNEGPFVQIINLISSIPPEKIQKRYDLVNFLVKGLEIREPKGVVYFLKNLILSAVILVPKSEKEKVIFDLINELLDCQKEKQKRLEILAKLLESINGKELVDVLITTLEKLKKLNPNPYWKDEGNMLILELSKRKGHYDIAARLLERWHSGKYYAPEIFEAAQYYEKAGNLEKALEMYQQGIELCSPSRLETYDENTGGYVSVSGNIYAERLYAKEIEEARKRVEICERKVKELKRKIAERKEITGKSIPRKRK